MNLNRLLPGLKIAFLVLAGVFAIVFLMVAASTVSVMANLQSGDLAKATIASKIAQIPVSSISFVSGGKIPELEILKYSLLSVGNYNDNKEEIGKIFPADNSNTVIDFRAADNFLTAAKPQLQPLLKNLEKSALAKQFISSRYPALRGKFNLATPENLEVISRVIKDLANRSQTWIILLQNSEELRAAGGFSGSYAILKIENGQLRDIIIEDIYDADGQIVGYIEPPPGVKEYLAGNRGLRLPDANWFADYRSSGQQLVYFFEASGFEEIEGVAAVNLPVIADLLEVAGPISLVDYKVSLNSNSLASLLHSERSDFFAGSKEKKHLLSQAMTGLRLAVQDLPNHKKAEAVNVIVNAAESKNLLAYSENPMYQQFFASMQIDGSLDDYGSDEFVYLIESNVGINKANRGISRKINVIWSEAEIEIGVDFTNSNLPKSPEQIAKEAAAGLQAAPHNGYVNYQRILVKPDWELMSLNYQGKNIESIDENTIETADGKTFKQLGFLITLSEGQSGRLEMKFSKPVNLKAAASTIAILKQPGIGDVPLVIATQENQIEIELNSDQVIALPSLQQITK